MSFSDLTPIYAAIIDSFIKYNKRHDLLCHFNVICTNVHFLYVHIYIKRTNNVKQSKLTKDATVA